MRNVLLFLLAWLWFGPSVAAAQPLKGVVWEAPADVGAAAADLRDMREAGVEAVRTGLIQDGRLLTLADTLGLQLFQEVPLERLSAGGLLDSLQRAAELLAPALGQARLHPSARHFGLARSSDTSDPAACVYFEKLAAFVRERAPAGTRVYYTTPFVEHDRCAGAVDFVLLNALDADVPEEMLGRWRRAHAASGAAQVGIGALGTWVGAERQGLNVPYSPEAQARYLEERLNRLLKRSPEAPYAVFVYRWRDRAAVEPSVAYSLENPYQRTYGLFDGAARRPAYRVVAGVYGGEQTVFAFSTGEVDDESVRWRILLGWGVFLMLGAFYAFSPRLRFMVPRYFTAHGFYRDAVREGRDVLLGPSTTLLVAVGLTVGLLWSLFLETARSRRAFAVLYGWLPEGLQDMMIALLAQPWVLALLVGCVYMVGLVVWSGLLALGSRRRYPLSTAQATMLVVWPRWPMLLVLLGAMVASTLAPEASLEVVLGLLGVWMLITFYAVSRTLFDYSSITRVPFYVTLGLFVANPLVMLSILLFFLSLEYQDELQFLWHLIRYT